MKFPKKLKHNNKGRVLATIYKRPDAYRLYWRARVDGKPKSMMRDFSAYAAAKREGDKVVADLAKGKAAGLSPGQMADAQNAIEELQRYYVTTGKRVSIRFAVGEWCEASRKLEGRSLPEAVDGFLGSVAKVRRKDLKAAVVEFAALEKAKTQAPDGQRPEIGAAYVRQKSAILVKFAAMLPGYAVCDIGKAHVDAFIKALDRLPSKRAGAAKPASPKTRNHHRTTLGQFFRWSARNDYLPANHRLLEAESMKPEKTNNGETQFYSAREFRALLEAAEGPMRAIVAIGGLAGLRTAELLRLDWADVWHVEGHIEVTAGKSKTRQRRLVETCPALRAWLAPFRQLKSGKLWTDEENRFHEQVVELCDAAKVDRKTNALRHSFCTYHFAVHANENYTAQQAGNSPAMVHAHYKGLATKAEAEKWFKVRPARPSNVVPLAGVAAS